ncbi:RNaseH domain-containing protein [Streptomyces sp. DT2A-34]|uniref:RNaseH domain-containing protein n=1 Tax=Streptomyces sp. DT2A-34 TaxID=3051182 RepID=UPI003464201D
MAQLHRDPDHRAPSDSHQAQDLAALAAALCHQSLAWDARTRHPVPLRVAGAVDRNHPEYRGVRFETETTEESDEDAS